MKIQKITVVLTSLLVLSGVRGMIEQLSMLFDYRWKYGLLVSGHTVAACMVILSAFLFFKERYPLFKVLFIIGCVALSFSYTCYGYHVAYPSVFSLSFSFTSFFKANVFHAGPVLDILFLMPVVIIAVMGTGKGQKSA